MPNKQSKYYIKLTTLTVLGHLFYSILLAIFFRDANLIFDAAILFLIYSITTFVLNLFVFVKLRWEAEFIFPGIFLFLLTVIFSPGVYFPESLILSPYGIISIGCGIYIKVRANQGRLLKDKN